MRVRLSAGVVVACLFAVTAIQAQIPGRNVNMVAGMSWPDGDPFLQRQNEPSIAASTRNPLHLLGGSNDYRTVDLPGVAGADERSDAWLGLFKSVDGGQRWISTLVPGYPQDPSAEGQASPLFGYSAGADPVVRAGTNGLFYYSGLVFDRGEDRKSAIVVARFIDNNNREDHDAIRYWGASIVASTPDGGGRFFDKPWMAVDIPRGGNPHQCTVVTPGEDGPITQRLPAGTVYVAYSSITGSGASLQSEILFTRSYDCGVTWQPAIKVSRDEDPVNQGASIAIDPERGDVYVAWRRFSTAAAPDRDAMMVAKLSEGGRKFNNPGVARRLPNAAPGQDPAKYFEHHGADSGEPAADVGEFDQGTSPWSFRSNAYPTTVVDGGGRLYVAWSERGYAVPLSDPGTGDARVLIVTSTDGATFTPAQPVDNSRPDTHALRGHQIMPSLAYAGGQLMLAYYDLRETAAATFAQYISDQVTVSGLRHTIDVRVAMGTGGPSPSFEPSVKVSSYLTGYRGATSLLEQLQVNPPNLPMFRLGNVPFMGDYIDLASAPSFVLDEKGRWRFNTEPTPKQPVFHLAWTDNRDVRPPLNGDWTQYTPATLDPGAPPRPSLIDPDTYVAACEPGNAGSRNQNIYTARITGGLLAGSPGNTKPLSPTLQRAFVVFAHNTTPQPRAFRMTILNQPTGGRASFDQFPRPPYHAASPPPRIVIDMLTPGLSSASRSVYITSTDPRGKVSIDVSELTAVGGTPVSGGLSSVVQVNPDLTNPEIENPEIENPEIENTEVYNPEIENPEIENPEIENPEIENPEIENPEIENVMVANPEIENPEIENSDIANPEIENPEIENPEIENPEIENGTITDITWNVTNTGNTTAAFNINLFLSRQTIPAGLAVQLILHKTYRTPVTVPNGCDLRYESRNVILANIPSPAFVRPGDSVVRDQNDPSDKNATMWMAPGEGGRITLRVVDPDISNNVTIINSQGEEVSVDPAFDPQTEVTPGISSQGVDPEDPPGATEPPIVTPSGANIIFLQHPTTTIAGAAIDPPVSVRVWDNAGAVLPGVLVTLSLDANPTGAVLTGETASTGPDGIATFPLLAVDRVGTPFVLRATASTTSVIAMALSAPFAVYEGCSAEGVATVASYIVDGPVVPDRPKFIQAGMDWTGDGLEDAAVVSAGGVIHTMRNTGAGAFSQRYIFATGTPGTGPASGLAAGDYNEDGEIDLLVGKDDGFAFLPLVNGGPVSPPDFITTGGPVLGITSAFFTDIEGDFLDVAVVRSTDVLVLYGTGFGGFPLSRAVALGAPLVAPTDVAAADIDGDGDTDVIVADASGAVGQVVVFRDDGMGVFTAMPPVGVGDTPSHLAVRDLDGDGHLDVAVANNGSGDISVLFGNSAFGFPRSTTVTTGFVVADLTAGDYNSDGVGDLAATQTATSTLHLWFGQPGSPFTFVNPQSFATDPQPIGVATADFNGDGRADLATANNGEAAGQMNTMSVLLGSCGAQTANLTVLHDDAPEPGIEGLPVTYTVAVVNNGPFTATNVTLQHELVSTAVFTFEGALPAQGTCSVTAPVSCALGTIAPGDAAVVEITYTPGGSGVPLAFRARAASSQLDLVPADNAVVESTVIVPLSLTVTNTSDSGGGSLRQAISTANLVPGPQTITFAIPGAGPHTIALAAELPIVGDQVTIDGTTQAGYDGLPMVIVDGAATGGGASGFRLEGNGSVVRGLSVMNFATAGGGYGVLVRGAGNRVEQNLIGLDRFNVSGPNHIGVYAAYAVTPLVSGNTIGASNSDGIVVAGGIDPTIENNVIGLTPDMTTSRGNSGNGITMYDGSQDTIIRGNTIGSNLGWGIDLQHSGGLAIVNETRIRANVIGLGAASVPMGNALGGVRVQRTADTTVGEGFGGENYISANGGPGVRVVDPLTSGTIIQSNYIGTDLTVELARPNVNGVVLGAAATVRANFLSGNGDPSTFSGSGLVLEPDAGGTVVTGNAIGLSGGGAALPNGFAGIQVSATSTVTIGGAGPSDRNTISGNEVAGIAIYQGFGPPPPSGTVIQGNFIGTDQAGIGPVPNGVAGVFLIDATNITIGGVAAGEGNVIAFNGGGAFPAVNGGVTLSSASSFGITVRGNRIEQNAGLGIDLGADGVTPNDPAPDADPGANGLQNAPVITSVTPTPSSSDVNGVLESMVGSIFNIDVYQSASCDASGFGEGRTFLGSGGAVTSAGGLALWTVTVPVSIPVGAAITVTATSASGSTSEFSNCFVVP